MTDPKLIEIVARALAPIAWAALGTGDTLAHANRRTASLRHAATALAAINASGTHWVAPIERTEAMREAMLGQPHSASTAETWTAVRDAYLAEPKA